MEKIARADPRVRLARINPQHPEVPEDLAGRALAVSADAGTLTAVLAT